MSMYDIIKHKRDGRELTPEELTEFVAGFSEGSIPDYQAAALCMAIFYQGMTSRETARFTWEMAVSGDMIDLSAIPGTTVDKHSTGGVGDKTTFVCGPIVASCGVPVAKMSGRGLGHTGGTLDKLESIPGLSIELANERFFEIVREIGIAVIGQSANLVPADKKLYALRDVTATVDSVPLIASSIMSKKIAAGSDCILLDVKCGSGAFMKTPEAAIELAQEMVAIGTQVGRRCAALITDMDQPLGMAIGNSLEVIEALDVLKGKGPADLTRICVELAANMLVLAEVDELPECRRLAQAQIDNGHAFEKFEQMVAAQGGDTRVLHDTSLFAQPQLQRVVSATSDGWIYSMDTELCGRASVELGAGRRTKEESIDYAAGIVLQAKTGSHVAAGDPIATLYASHERQLDEAAELLTQAIVISQEQPVVPPHFFARVTEQGVETYDEA
ncbi:MAG: pyrimidine-nucleoside phosphorylase [Atopobiaceae bacterium]|nr:pyrimidine-nucleoside phosphorylase [Atopobiaceae bacterium]